MTKKQYEKIDTKELKRDDKKEKKEHEKDALEDDDSKIKKLKKGNQGSIERNGSGKNMPLFKIKIEIKAWLGDYHVSN